MQKRKIKKFIGNTKTIHTRKEILCKVCNNVFIEVALDIGSVTCSNCVQCMMGPPPASVKKPDHEKFPRGWHFKAKFIAPDGRVFERGVETGKIEKSVSTKKKKTSTKEKSKSIVQKNKKATKRKLKKK